MIKGNDILIYEDGVAVAASVANDVQTNTELREISSPMSGRYREYEADMSSWSLSLNFLVLDMSDRLLHRGHSVMVRVMERDGSASLQGRAMITEAKVTSSVGRMAEGSWKFVGCGILEEVEDD